MTTQSDELGERRDATPGRWSSPDAARALVLLGLGHGVLLALTLPPVGLWWLTFVALVPGVIAAERIGAGRVPAWRGAAWFALGALPAWAYLHVWIMNISALGFVPLAVLMATYSGVGVWVMGLLHRRMRLSLGVIVPLAWTASEFLRGEVLWDGYPWGLASHPLIEWAWAANPASIGGQYLVLLLLAGVSGAMIDLARAPSRRVGVGLLAGWVVAWIGLAWLGRDTGGAGTMVRVAVVQTNVPQDNKTNSTIEREVKDWQRFEAMTVEAAGHSPAFIVWPETMLPGPTLDPAGLKALAEEGIFFNFAPDPANPSQPTRLMATAFADRLLDVQEELGLPLVVGALGHDGYRVSSGERVEIEWDARYNSAYVVDGGRISRERYDKLRLTPFGEVMPYISKWPWLERQLLSFGARGMSFDLAAGTTPTVLPVRAGDGVVRVVTPICFEVTTAWVCRRLVFEGGTRRADVIVNLTNDGWFSWWDGGREQHLQIARWRCVELRTWMVRAANTGVSAIVDAGGRVVRAGVVTNGGGAGRCRVDGVLVGDVGVGGPVTVYARVGDSVGWMMLALTGLGLAASRWWRRPGEAA
ncbi:MAG: apolipoprotein N-acyltransferase [Phycisphaerales bacterium]|nr:apolipoprotein N-acyltransferase [Phycisphaerales bacterium]